MRRIGRPEHDRAKSSRWRERYSPVMMRPCGTTWSSSGPASAAASPRSGWPRRATASAVLEAGRRFADDEFPQTSWRLRRFLWAPRLGCYGIQRITLLRPADRRSGGGVLVLSGAGVGGGSLVYANTLYEPLAAFYTDPQWRRHHRLARRAGPPLRPGEADARRHHVPGDTGADRAMRAVAERMGVGHTFHATPVGRAHRPSPASGSRTRTSAAPARSAPAASHCGACMTGCRHGAKNTLVKNYLWLAERLGARGPPADHGDRRPARRRRRLRGAHRPHRRPGCASAAR